MREEVEKIKPRRSDTSLENARIAFTGKLLSMTQRDARSLVTKVGAEPTTSISRRTSMLVVGMGGWPLLSDGKVSSALRRAETLNGRGARIRIISEEEFLEALKLKEKQPARPKTYTADEICELTGVEPERLRRWEQLSLIRSSHGRYDFQDMVSLRTIADLVGRGVRPEVINKSFRGLAAVLPGTDRPLAQLQVVTENSETLLAELEECLITADGQMVMNFDEASGSDIPNLQLLDEEGELDSESWMERGQYFEEEERFEEAADAYRKAIALEPSCPESFYNLGNVLRALERPDAALEMFRLALALDPNLTEAWYNVADVLEEQGCIKEAIEHLNQTLDVTSTFADAYYNLALCHEKLGDTDRAQHCWSEYLKLDPQSEWANVARQHLAGQLT